MTVVLYAARSPASSCSISRISWGDSARSWITLKESITMIFGDDFLIASLIRGSSAPMPCAASSSPRPSYRTAPPIFSASKNRNCWRYLTTLTSGSASVVK
jgi:hypothetical protein